jgi:hypothetical protein
MGRATGDVNRQRQWVHFSRRKKGGRRGWANLGRKAEQSGSVPWKKSAGHKEDAGRNVNGLQKLFSNFKKIFGFKMKGFKYIGTEFELKHTKINLNKLFEDF